MPGDLRDPEQWFPWHHDDLYNPGRNTFDPGIIDLDSLIQDISFQYVGYRLSNSKLKELKDYLAEKGMLRRHWGDEVFRDEIRVFLSKKNLARKVAFKWLTLIN